MGSRHGNWATGVVLALIHVAALAAFWPGFLSLVVA